MARIEVEGAEQVPARGGAVLVFNQLSFIDTPLLPIVMPRRDVTGLVARSYRDHWLFGPLVRTGGGMWLARGVGDRKALDEAVRYLRAGFLVGISPEGRRSPTGGLIRGKPGVTHLARRADVPIVPVAFVNTTGVLPALRRGRRATISVRIGEPFRLPRASETDRAGQRRNDTDLVMTKLAALLPESYRGVYGTPPTADVPTSQPNPGRTA